MKQLVLFLTFLLPSWNFLFSQSPLDAGSFINTISLYQDQISKSFLSFESAIVYSKSAKKVENKRRDLIESVINVKNKILSMSCPEQDCSLKDSMISNLTLYYYVLNSEYDRIIDMEEVSFQSYDLMETYLRARIKANEKIRIASDNLEVVLKDFATRHGVSLVKRNDFLVRQIERINNANDVYNIVYLMLFKSFKQEENLINALNKKDYNNAELSRNLLVQFSTDGLNNIDTVRCFQNDRSLIGSCKRSLEFYKLEAQKNFCVTIDFLKKQEVYDNLKKTVGSKDPMFRSKDESEHYSQSIKDYNDAMIQYKVNGKPLDQQRKAHSDDWNNTVLSFFERYVPRFD